ncbi:zf-HC2 domain-containing protein [Candidatus Binatia bacterium]|jgi:anti-sigma factor RsiW|nr:zf-HC2 domain-containing protein [Candidatus Binatia bacterium]
MTCRELNDFLADYRSGELLPEVRSRFEAHLLRCATCAAYVRSYGETIRLARAAGDDLEQQLLPTEAPRELVDAILDSVGSAPPDADPTAPPRNPPRPRR